MKPWIAYSLLRLGVFAAAFTVLMIAGTEPWLAAVIATVLGFAISYVFFGKLRDAVALDFAARREGPSHDPDREAEDAEADLETAAGPETAAYSATTAEGATRPDAFPRTASLEGDRQSETDAEQQSSEPRQL
ncbi:DUF4229 domain-containing protein [Salinibacterium sp. SWN1162]|uniref:DUF4229 domain-containing protein n=1 Tax=Salinibacterium sp. SWN1162 TaxID=2792053 RepID=UPI0018CFD2E7|nr:DUF4229 domain-containing protein [Salinibacterium sp. SWN1162]MBH0009684.1 DUF4229 domain-containing protein [Salinibacterium sp. SWN1162]